MRGFTLIELLLSMALIAIIAGFTIPLYRNVQAKTDLDSATLLAVGAIRRATALARGVHSDSTWGVHIATTSITIFRGASYAARVTINDEVFDMAPAIQVSGKADYVFSRMMATTTPGGTTTLRHTLIDESRNIGVNRKGAVNYE